MIEINACKGRFGELYFRDNQIYGGEDIEKIWNQMIVLLFTQDMFDGGLKCFLVTGYFQALKHNISCGITTSGKWRWNCKVHCKYLAQIPPSVAICSFHTTQTQGVIPVTQ